MESLHVLENQSGVYVETNTKQKIVHLTPKVMNKEYSNATIVRQAICRISIKQMMCNVPRDENIWKSEPTQTKETARFPKYHTYTQMNHSRHYRRTFATWAKYSCDVYSRNIPYLNKDTKVENYKLYRHDRQTHGGGVAIAVRCNIDHKLLSIQNTNSIECISVAINIGQKQIVITPSTPLETFH